MRSWRAELRPSFCVIGRHGVQELCLQNPNRGPRFAGAAAATRRPGLGSFLSSTVQTRIDSGISSMLNHDLRQARAVTAVAAGLWQAHPAAASHAAPCPGRRGSITARVGRTGPHRRRSAGHGTVPPA